MISYNSEKDFIRDQISSFNAAIKAIKQMSSEYEKNTLLEMRGDNKKVLDALEQATKHLKAERTKLKETYFGKKTSKYTPRKFLYQETNYFGDFTFKIEWTNKGLSVIKGTIPLFPDESEGITINPSDETWEGQPLVLLPNVRKSQKVSIS